MLIYIIEDYELKAERIEAVVRGELPHVQVDRYRSFNSGLKAIFARTPDMVLLDMSLPSFDMLGSTRFGRPRSLGGYDILRKMALRNIHSRVLVITQLDAFGDGTAKMSFKEITSKCFEEFPKNFIGSVYFSQTSDDWVSKLKAVLHNDAGGNQ